MTSVLGALRRGRPRRRAGVSVALASVLLFGGLPAPGPVLSGPVQPQVVPPAQSGVVIMGNQFNPADVSVRVGDTVEWSNFDAADHEILPEGKEFAPARLKAGQKFDFVVTKAGKLGYICSIHPQMKGSVTVQPAVDTLVKVENNRFNPVDVTVKVGDTVGWEAATPGTVHNIASDNNEWTPFDIGMFPGVLQHTFAKEGKFTYKCTIHAGMTGSITVGAGGAAQVGAPGGQPQPPPPPPPPGGGPPPPPGGGAPAQGADPALAAKVQLYVPLAMKAAGGWDAGIQVQNTDAAEVEVNVSYYQNGVRVASENAAKIAAGQSKTFFLPSNDRLPAGFTGAAVVGATGQVAGIVNLTNYNVNGSGKSGTTAYNAINGTEAGAVAFVPTLKVAKRLEIFNPGAGLSYKVTYYNAEGREVSNQPGTIPAQGSASIDASGPVGQGAASAKIETTGGNPAPPIAVLNWGDSASASSVPMYVSFPAVGQAPVLGAYAPLVMRRPTGWGTEIAIMNLGDQQTVTVEFLDSTGKIVAGATTSVTLPANGTTSLAQLDSTTLPADFVGAANITATRSPVAVVVMQFNRNLNQGTGYRSVQTGQMGPKLYAPLVFIDRNGWATGIQVQNVDQKETVVDVVVFDSDNKRIGVKSTLVPPQSSTTVYVPGLENIPKGIVGSAVITSQSNAQLIGIASQNNYIAGGGGDNAMTYVLVPTQ